MNEIIVIHNYFIVEPKNKSDQKNQRREMPISLQKFHFILTIMILIKSFYVGNKLIDTRI